MKNVKLGITSFYFMIATVLMCQEVVWKVEDGWVVNVNDRFFAIGMYGIPGYSLNKMDVRVESRRNPQNRYYFDRYTSYFNTMYIQSGYFKPYMSNKTFIIGTSEFPYWLKKKYNLNSDNLNSYYFMNKLETESKNGNIDNILNQIISKTENAHPKNNNIIWSPFDEVASGFNGWAWPTELTEKIYSLIKKKNKNNLVFLNLLGGGVGNSYLLKQLYKEQNKKLPLNPPFKEQCIKFKNPNLRDLHVDYKGNSIYDLTKSNRTLKQLNSKEYENVWFQNVRKTASGYKNSADIFGFNSYKSFFDNPLLAGITVDAIRAGVGNEAPIWIFFDGNGHAKPRNVSFEAYAESIKAQIYLSLIHGATGVLFWNSNEKQPEQFEHIMPILDELKYYSEILKNKTIDSKLDDQIQFALKQNDKGDNYLILVNTDKEKTVNYDSKYIQEVTLKPLQSLILNVELKK